MLLQVLRHREFPETNGTGPRQPRLPQRDVELCHATSYESAEQTFCKLCSFHIYVTDTF